MADRRIDQLTEAEDISDEDIFVIWKENISQTRGIKKGTMGLASKSYVDTQVSSMANSMTPDWGNAVSLTYRSLVGGYICPNNGLFVCSSFIRTNGQTTIYINNIPVAKAGYSLNEDLNGVNCQCLVAKDDVVTVDYSGSSTSYLGTIHFVPFKIN